MKENNTNFIGCNIDKETTQLETITKELYS